MAADPLPFGHDPSRTVRATITQATLERAYAILMAVAAVGFGASTYPQVVKQLPHLDPFWGPFVALAMGAAILFVGLSAIVHSLARPAQIALAMVFLLALITWPFLTPGHLPAGQVPWLWWLCNIGTIAAVIGLSVWRAAVYNILVPLAYVILRTTPSGGGVSLARAVLDGVYIMILGGAALILIVVLRRAAMTVDRAQAMAVRRYARAKREHATELERVQVDAIVHDSVLTTLLSAARAYSPESMALSATMASNAIAHLASASVDVPAATQPVTLEVLRARITAAVSELAAPVGVLDTPLTDLTVPAPVADALASAALQAAVNSVQHAGSVAVQRTVTVSAMGTDGVRVMVVDDGAGFDIHAVPSERLGVRRSILERVASVGGEARVLSTPGVGTRVLLDWSEHRAAEIAAALEQVDELDAGAGIAEAAGASVDASAEENA
jgi:signal transduction histidine kinase